MKETLRRFFFSDTKPTLHQIKGVTYVCLLIFGLGLTFTPLSIQQVLQIERLLWAIGAASIIAGLAFYRYRSGLAFVITSALLNSIFFASLSKATLVKLFSIETIVVSAVAGVTAYYGLQLLLPDE